MAAFGGPQNECLALTLGLCVPFCTQESACQCDFDIVDLFRQRACNMISAAAAGGVLQRARCLNKQPTFNNCVLTSAEHGMDLEACAETGIPVQKYVTTTSTQPPWQQPLCAKPFVLPAMPMHHPPRTYGQASRVEAAAVRTCVCALVCKHVHARAIAHIRRVAANVAVIVAVHNADTAAVAAARFYIECAFVRDCALCAALIERVLIVRFVEDAECGDAPR